MNEQNAEYVRTDHGDGCHHKDDSAVEWNEWNRVWQCHACGAVEREFEDIRYPREERTDG